MNVAFLGLGAMGSRMAHNVVRGGHAVTVWNRTAEKATPFAGSARIAPSSQEAVRGAEVVILMLSDPAAVLELVGEIAPALPSGAVLVDMSTIDPATARVVAARVRGAGASYLDAPVSGSLGPAERGELVILAAGDQSSIERVRPVLETMGRPRRVGDVGQGMAMKLVLNAIGAHMMTGFAAALTLGAKQGLSTAAMVDVIQAGAFASPLYAAKGEKIARRDFRPDFTLELMRKDQLLVLETARALGYAMPTESAICDVLDQAIAAGLGQDDLSGIVRWFEAQT